MSDPLALFSPPVAAWFRRCFREPTPPQAQGWPAIARGEHALIVSPTGSGKTLTAFLWSLDVLFRELAATPEPENDRLEKGRFYKTNVRPGVRVLYVSPLKALNNDVERNLQAPLAGIREEASRAGQPLPELRVGLRTGDTPGAERQRMLRRPPHVLITTPESLYLMLTAERARALFATVHTVVVDEIHTLVGTKRGAHLALSLERLTRLAERPPQRVGLSATVRPLENAARFLGGQDEARDFAPRPVAVVDAGQRKQLDLAVVTPVESFRDLPGDSIWSEIVPRVVRLIEQHRTTLIFCNSRRLAERTADRLNERRLLEKLGADALRPAATRRGAIGADVGMFAAGVDRAQLEAAGLQPIRAHHGSMSRHARLEMEGALKSGALPALVATSSLELGIDIGEIDLVVHLQSPKSVASGLQRIGRSGHLVGQTPVGRIFTTHVEDVMEAAAVARGMLRGEIEATRTPENPLDVLSQQLLAMVATEEWSYEALYRAVRCAYPFRNLGPAAFRGVVEMLAGRYPERVSRQLQARIVWDRVNDRLAALPGSRPTAIQSGGTIPDRGTYAMVLPDRRTKVGELDEEFVFETRKGDTFLLGSQVWRAVDIAEDRVVAEPAPGEVPRMPFWRGDYPWRPYDLGRRIGEFRRRAVELLAVLSPADLQTIRDLTDHDLDAIRAPAVSRGADPHPAPIDALSAPALDLLDFLARDSALDRNSVVAILDYLSGQLAAVGHVATDRTVLVELFEDALGEPRMVVHSPFGGRVNGPWAIAVAGALRERFGVEAQVHSGDDGFLLRFANADQPPPTDVVAQMTSAEARERILAELPGSAVFGAQFRMNAARAMLLPRLRGGKRTPLWLSRLRAKDLLEAVKQFDDFPILLETYRDCLRDVMDLDGLTDVLDRIGRGEIRVVVHEAAVPSPVAVNLDRRFAMQYVYEYDAPRGERQLAQLSLNRALLAELLQDGALAELLRPEAVQAVAERAARTDPESRARTADELAQLLYDLGDLDDDELRARAVGDAAVWIAALAASGQAIRRTIGGRSRWVHAEHVGEYERLTEEPRPVLRRWLLHAGPTRPLDLAARYGLSEQQVRSAVEQLGDDVLVGRFTPEGGEQLLDRRNLEQMHRRTLAILRREVRPVSVHAYAAFLRGWQGVGLVGETGREPDILLLRALQQLRGFALPAVAWERDVLPARVPGFDPAALAARCQAGELLWSVEGGRDPKRARVRFFFRGEGALFLEREPDPAALAELGDAARAVHDQLAAEGAALLADLRDGTGLDETALRAALVELVLAGLVTNDTIDALRAVVGYEPHPGESRAPRSSLEAQLAELLPRDRPRPLTRHRLWEARRRARRTVESAIAAPRRPEWVGRWSLVHRTPLLGRPQSPEELSLRRARLLLTRWGIVSRAALERESPLLRWEALYPVLSGLEMRGEVRRGYFVEGLPGVQFALPEAVEHLRQIARNPDETPTVLSAVDPVQLFGAEPFAEPLRFQRVASSAVAAVGGEPVAVMEDGGAAVSALADHPRLVAALRALAEWWSTRRRGRLKVERCGGEPAPASPIAPSLEAAGFVRDYGGMVWAGRPTSASPCS